MSRPAPTSPSDSADPGEVNPHYLDHMVATAEKREVQASEDILAGNGMKLLAKGARIDAATRERLLRYKLDKPLESCVMVCDGVAPPLFGPLATELLERHPLLGTLCGAARLQALPLTLSTLDLSVPVQGLLTLYADHQGDRLAHSVGVAMLTLGLANRLLPNQAQRHLQLALAALLHDVGELYIDPAFLARDTPLQAEQWRHIASHPVIGHRVLKGMKGAGPAVAEAVLNHHERMDGFGYPRGLLEENFPIEHQILAAAEWLMALIDSGVGALARASVASRLIPGEFSPAILDVLNASVRQSDELSGRLRVQEPLLNALPTVERVAGALQRFKALRPWIDAETARASPGLRAALQLGLRRILRIQASFSSTGLDSGDPAATLLEMAGQPDPQLHQELQVLIDEFAWRLRQMEREALLRAGLLAPAELAVMQELLRRLRGEAAA
jgi:HD-GYP domain-containing protein (c-di-GMP phosphodiesterase class II)